MGAVLTRPVGVLLAGGRATRLGGVDKALLPLAGQPLLAYGIARLQPHCSALVVSANGDPSRFARFGLPVVADGRDGFDGPLAGLLATLDHIEAHHPAAQRSAATAVVTLPADTPFAPPDLVTRLQAAVAGQPSTLASAVTAGRVHHAATLWPVSVRDTLRDALADGERALSRFAARFPRALVEWPTEPFDPFLNINTPDDLAEATRLANAMVPGQPAPLRRRTRDEAP